MGEFADRVNAIKVQVVSPDNNIHVVLQGEGDITVEFRPKSYPQYSERGLEHQIERAATLVYTGYYKAYGHLMNEFDRNLKRGPDDARDPTEREYLTDRAELQVVGATERKAVRVKATGLYRWECRIAEGTLAELSEQEFLDELHGAIRNFLARYRTRMSVLFAKHYGSEDRKRLLELLRKQDSRFNKEPS